MTEDINKFIRIIHQKNGKIKIQYDFENQVNIYKWLREFGYRKSKLDNRVIYYREHDGEVKQTNFLKIKTAFSDFLQNGNYKNLPENINQNDILEWYYLKNPIKENSLLKHILEDELSNTEIHSLRMQTNHSYEHRFQINEFIKKLLDWGFKKTIDKISSYSSDPSPLYYKQISKEEYLIFNHFASEAKCEDGFDCWIGIYQNEKLIGKKNPSNIESVQLDFEITRDITLIEKFLN